MPRKRQTRIQKIRRNRKRLRTRKQSGGRKLLVNVPNTHITKAWVITLEPEGSRLRNFARIAEEANLPFTPFQGVNGLTLRTSTLPTIGIGKVIFMSRGDTMLRRNMGTIGCYLSHRSLYETIIRETDNLNDCHLVFEDDVTFPPDILDILSNTIDSLPDNWDIIYLSKKVLKGKRISPLFLKLDKTTDAKSNFGTWAQIYRTRFLKEKLLPHLANMTDELDAQINRMFDDWNAYCFDPPLVLTRSEAGSHIHAMD